MLRVLVFLLLLVTSNAIAQEKLKCLTEGFSYKEQQAVLNEGSKRGGLYFIHNISDIPIWIDHYNPENPRLSTGWASLLKPNHWSAIILSQKNFALTCARSKTGTHTEVNCEDYVSVCKTTILKNRKILDDYWYVEDVSAEEFIRAIFAKLKMA